MKTKNLLYASRPLLAALVALGPMNDVAAGAKPADKPSALATLNAGERNATQIALALGELKDEFDGLREVKPDDRDAAQNARVVEIVNIARALRVEHDQLVEMSNIDERRIDDAIGNNGRSGGDVEESRRNFHNYLRATTPQDVLEAQNALTTSDGGQVQIPDFPNQKVYVHLQGFGKLMPVVDVHTTDHDGDYKWPTWDDTGNSGRQRASETEDTNGVDPVRSGLVLKSYAYTADKIEVSVRDLRSTSYDVDKAVVNSLLTRLNRKINIDAVGANGVSTINGIVNAAAAGVDSTGAGAFEFDDLYDLIDAIDPAYAEMPGSAFAMSRNMVTECLKKADTKNRYRALFYRGPNGYEFDGNPIVVLPQMAAVAVGNVPCVFGDLSAYKMRVVGAPRIYRSLQPNSKELIEFYGFWDADGDLVNADAVKKLTISA